ncbi:bacillithiol biosynthesis deacetylase BshB2 [Peribacillus alkalitolerans]|uniref:bacillithiol biosynthesis deacetylase BshB2 n=1 Tax=Peribacillus alkalitolerans TaxID=1550385 RepID=UPI0013D7421A|nr:bacillithiol biosynthesis deacetylase BshB2 [Peribacillus alkalitolerans]
MEKEKHVLVIFPHPDDEAFGVSGTIASYIKAGTPVTYACLTLGQMGRNLGNPPFATRESLPEIRRTELLDAAKVMGITDLRMLGYRDKTLEFEDEEELAESMLALIREVHPSLVITFYPGYSVHPDHEATGRAVVRAIKNMVEEDRPKLYGVAFAHNTLEELGEPHVIHNVGDVEDIKVNTVRSHRSQTQLMTAAWTEKLLNRDPDLLAWLHNERFWIMK